MFPTPSPAISSAGTYTSLTWGAAFPTIRASSEFPGSSVVERRTVNPLVGGSNPSRGAKLVEFAPRFRGVLGLDYIPTGWYGPVKSLQHGERSPSSGARSKLLDAAFSIIRQKGYAATSVD